MKAIANNHEETLTERLKNSTAYALQMDVSWDPTDTKSRTKSRKRTELYRAIIAGNSIPTHIAQIIKQIKQHLKAQSLSPI
jgi:hypothetical protein